mgnify:CR=1 FL=1
MRMFGSIILLREPRLRSRRNEGMGPMNQSWHNSDMHLLVIIVIIAVAI